MPKYPYTQVGTAIGRAFRNAINQVFKDIETDISEQKTRVDNLIISNPQPTEVQDARGGFPVLRDRLNKIDSDLNGRGINILFPPSPLVAAKGDGVSDDTTAIQNIINGLTNGGTVIIPGNIVI